MSSRRAKVKGLGIGLALLLTVLPGVRPLARDAAAAGPESAGTAAQAHKQHALLMHFYVAGIAELTRGDPAAAAASFAIADGVGGDLPQLHYLLALSRVLADFGQRQQSLALIRKSLAQDPQHPLYRILETLADPALSQLRPEGALYFTGQGTARLQAARLALAGAPDAYNGKYLAALLDGIEPTPDPALPQRLGHFAEMLGPGRHVHLQPLAEPQALGRLLVLSLPKDLLARA